VKKILLAILALVMGIGNALAKEWQVSEQLTVTEIADGVWVHTSWHTFPSGVRFPGNGLLVRDGAELVLVDTGWGIEATEELLDWIETTLALPVRQAIITHFHEDSLGGAAALAERGIPFAGHPLTRALAAGRGVPLPQPLPLLNAGDAVVIGELEVYYPGPAHSLDNLFVWVPRAAVLFGTCAIRTPGIAGRGNVADADVEHWPEAVRRAMKRYPQVRIVVPGHGEPGDASLLAYTIELFEAAP
jgi:glyoxylase-like metal-dependent hydrolase (beta-lactamase superfamily II)